MRISPGHCQLLNLSSRDAVPSTAGTVTTDNLSYVGTKIVEMRSNRIIANIRGTQSFVSIVFTEQGIRKCLLKIFVIYLVVLFHF